ncbi:hypothetical protein OIDMADRAFT_16397 [Oidiodendron maius Zn]|uniref:Uncharacterized protein n=1 Tax=Oidiodendron maius (strain Zn) TaxID=913774 RepID=A0A0C3I0G3_OIDMZ|nr:hypothetical protein OIDMADRAFT_16397 [Oidiodendron maius Zn]
MPLCTLKPHTSLTLSVLAAAALRNQANQETLTGRKGRHRLGMQFGFLGRSFALPMPLCLAAAEAVYG